MASTNAMISEEQQWPGVETAYDFVLPSYQLLTLRFESADTRLMAVFGWISTVTLGLPTLGKLIRPSLSAGSPLFILALIAGLAAAVLTIVGRMGGGVTLVNPMILFEKHLASQPWVFKKDAVYHAGVHFQANAIMVERKRAYAVAATSLLFAEVLALAVWIAL